ncbi:MAG: carboxylating nicotinate-nucleotide diphosphorylase [Bacteroidota bacterium]
MQYKWDINGAIDRWLEEDLGSGDHTTRSTIPYEAAGRARLLVKEEGILAGAEVAELVFSRIDPDLRFEPLITDGSRISRGDVVFRVSGRVHSILIAERLILNLMQRMSGIATQTGIFVNMVEGTGTRILDTRKTTPGMRMLEKEAVLLGGGTNHRIGLYDMILIKDNHIDFAGGIENAILRAGEYIRERGLDLKIEVETRSLEDVRKVLETGGVHRIMFDNFTPEQTRTAVQLVGGRYETESSGGIRLDTIRSFAECGVDFISVGALTHQIRSLDLSLKADF